MTYTKKDTDGYFGWLIRKVGVKERSGDKVNFLWQLFNMQFYFSIPNDINRKEDGLRLRDLYMAMDGRAGIPNMPCSVLEVLVGFSNRIAEEVLGDYSGDGEGTVEWFWRMVRNLGITSHKGDVIMSKSDICSVIERWLHRDFSYYGHGSPFPLNENSPVEDQRGIEIWQQFCIYLAENPWLEG